MTPDRVIQGRAPRRAAIVVAVAAAATWWGGTVPTPAGARQEGAPETAASTRIPFELEEHLIWLQVRVNGAGPFTVLLDSAAQFSALDIARASALGIAPTRKALSAGSGGAVSIGLARNVTFGLGDQAVAIDPVILQPLDFVRTGVGRRLDGILGAEVFLRHVVEIDYGRLVVTLHNPKTYAYGGKGDALALKLWQGRTPLVQGAVAMTGREPIEGDFQVDTGSAQVLTLCSPFVDRNGLLDLVPKTIPSNSTGVGGESPELVGRLDGVRLGSQLLASPIVRFSRATQGVFAMNAFAGNIGSELLSRFTVVFDYARERMFLEPNAHVADPFVYNMSGIQLELEEPGGKAFAVHAVAPGSPAAEAGLLGGDVITAIDGRPASEYRLSAIRRMFKEEGRELNLRIRRNGRTRELSLRLRMMI